MSAVLLAMSLAVLIQADEQPEAASDAPLVTAAKEHVAGWTLAPASDADRPYTLEPEPVFRHVQHVRGDATGSLFLWRDDSGRPAAICDVFFFPPKDGQTLLRTEWHSLAPEPLTARLKASAWAPDGPGLEWKEIPGARPPDESADRRRRQIRQLARRFTAHIINSQDDRYELRLIATPLDAYETQSTATMQSGALFAFCQETDPEVLLMIESRDTDAGPTWHYAVAEFSNLRQYVHLDGDEVWAASPPTFSSSGPHWASHGGYVPVPVGDGE